MSLNGQRDNFIKLKGITYRDSSSSWGAQSILTKLYLFAFCHIIAAVCRYEIRNITAMPVCGHNSSPCFAISCKCDSSFDKLDHDRPVLQASLSYRLIENVNQILAHEDELE
jgi:hypothetical protein